MRCEYCVSTVSGWVCANRYSVLYEAVSEYSVSTV